MIFIKPKKEKRRNLHQVLATLLKYKYADFITEKILIVFLHQELQLNLELFHTSIRKKIEQNKTQKKKNKNYKLIGC